MGGDKWEPVYILWAARCWFYLVGKCQIMPTLIFNKLFFLKSVKPFQFVYFNTSSVFNTYISTKNIKQKQSKCQGFKSHYSNPLLSPLVHACFSLFPKGLFQNIQYFLLHDSFFSKKYLNIYLPISPPLSEIFFGRLDFYLHQISL